MYGLSAGFKNPIAALLTAGLALMSNAAYAACDTTSNPVQISTNCEDLSINSVKSAVSIGTGATVSPFFNPLDAVVVNSAGSVTGVFLNQGTITNGFGHNGFVNHGIVSVLVNEGLITNTSGSDNRAAVINANFIGTLTNRGTISATVGDWGSGAHGVLQSARIGTLDNSGVISAQNSAIYFSPGFNARIDTLINSGLIQGGINGGGSSTFASAIEVGPGNSIGTIVNRGIIDHSVCDAGGTCYAAINNAGGSIDTITNLGTLTSGNTGTNAYGIINGITGTIGTLNNAQADLKYYGRLPANYNTIISSPTAYGRLAVTGGWGQFSYGVAPGSTFSNGVTYTNVLTGVTASNLLNTTGTYGSGLVATTWRLSNSLGTQWDLTSASVAVKPDTGSSSGNKLGSAITFAYTAAVSASAGPTAPTAPNTPTAPTGPTTPSTPTGPISGPVPIPVTPVLVSGANLIAAVQSLTPTQTTSLANVHAEGYSSNLTINLEQMGQVTNSVMDRIHAPMSGQTGKAAAYEIDQGRFFWIDANTMNGKVNGYDNLAGFGYRLSSIIIGRDLYRDPSGGIGVFGGVGYTTMTESEQVQQSFKSTNAYLGLYGGRYLQDNFKLSGAFGYVFSDSSAIRDNPNVGDFTGGQASSSYQSNGAFGAMKLSRPILASQSITITPFVGASYSQLWMKQANEAGGNDFNYSISATSGRSALTFVGGELMTPLNSSTATPLSLIAFYRFAYDWYANSNSAHEVTANSTLFGSFSQVGANKGPVNNLVGLGLQGNLSRGVSIRAGLVGRLSTHGTEFGGGGEIRWEL